MKTCRVRGTSALAGEDGGQGGVKFFMEEYTSKQNLKMSVGRYRAGKDVFISYDREDTVKEFVRKLKRGLEGAQLSVWLDKEDIPAGTEKPVLAIGIALRDCKALVVVVTKKYISSSFCKSELCVACETKKPVFPVIREEGWDVSPQQPVFKECTEGVKYMKATSNCVSFLPSDDYGAALQKLTAGLRESVARPLHRPSDGVKKQGVCHGSDCCMDQCCLTARAGVYEKFMPGKGQA